VGDKSTPEVIYQHFHMSKSDFKQAAGSLYKLGRITKNID
jgi:predicted RNA-binding protein (virulence factor B family)